MLVGLTEGLLHLQEFQGVPFSFYLCEDWDLWLLFAFALFVLILIWLPWTVSPPLSHCTIDWRSFKSTSTLPCNVVG